jgi:hypothetical protein
MLATVTDPHTPHDALFKGVFSQAENALAVFRSCLPAPVTAAIDPGSLRLEPGSFVDAELRQRHTDLLFTATLSGRGTLIYLLFEHQSTLDLLMPVRLHRYVVRVWEKWLSENPRARRVPAVIPLVLYQGPKPWSGPRSLADMIDLPPELLAVLGAYVPAFEFLLEDLGAKPADELRSREAPPLARLALVLMKAALGTPDLLATLDECSSLIEAVLEETKGGERLGIVLRYTLSQAEVSPRVLADRLKRTVGPRAAEVAMSTAERLIQQGAVSEARKLLERQLRLRFGPLPSGVVTTLDEARLEDLELWTERFVTTPTLEAIFRADP